MKRKKKKTKKSRLEKVALSRSGVFGLRWLLLRGGDWKGVKAGGGAREFVLPCRTFGIGQAALTVTKQAI